MGGGVVSFGGALGGAGDLDGVRTYAMRAMHSRVMKPNATGVLEPTDQIIWRSGRVTGDNNGNNGKGGTYRANMMAVMKVGRDGLEVAFGLRGGE